MKFSNLAGYLFVAMMAVTVVGCESIPPEQLKNYGLVQSSIGVHGSDIDHLPPNYFENAAYISYVDFKVNGGSANRNIAPGEYTFQVGLGCDNTATCRPSMPYKIKVEAGKRYVLKPGGLIYVSDRFASRKNEVLYRAQN